MIKMSSGNISKNITESGGLHNLVQHQNHVHISHLNQETLVSDTILHIFRLD